MKGIPPIGAVQTGRKVVTAAEKVAKNVLPKEMPLPPNESKIIDMLHPSSSYYKALDQIQTTLLTKFDNLHK